jgi:ketosteroid isomerase-like protein
MWKSAESVALAFVQAINRHDVEILGELMAPRHRFIDSMGQVVEGRENARVAWGGYFRMVPDYSISVEEIFSKGPVVVMVGMAKGTYTKDGWLREENGWKTESAFRATIKDEKVAEWRVYADNEPMRQRIKASV